MAQKFGDINSGNPRIVIAFRLQDQVEVYLSVLKKGAIDVNLLVPPVLVSEPRAPSIGQDHMRIVELIGNKELVVPALRLVYTKPEVVLRMYFKIGKIWRKLGLEESKTENRQRFIFGAGKRRRTRCEQGK